MTALSSADPGRPIDWVTPSRAQAAWNDRAVYSSFAALVGVEHHAGHLAAADGDRHGQRAVVALDIGVHLELEIPAGTGWREGERWNAEIAWEFLQAHSSWDEKRLRFELHRYLGWPGQAPSYKLGERIWLQAREEAKARAGDTFNLKDFHSKALSLGEMGLDPLREALARF